MTNTLHNQVFSVPTGRGDPSTRIMELPGAKSRVLLTEPRSEWTPSVVNRLEELIRLPVGWDGYRGEPVKFENASFALQMLNAVCGLETPAPQIVPGSAGDLQVEWHTQRGDIELHVEGPNSVHAWHAIAGGDPNGEEANLTTDFAAVAGWVRDIAEQPVGIITAA